MSHDVIEDPLEFERVSGPGRLFVVRFTPPGGERTLVLGIRVSHRSVSSMACVLRSHALSGDEICRTVAVTACKAMLFRRGVAVSDLIFGHWGAQPSTMESLMAEQRRIAATGRFPSRDSIAMLKLLGVWHD